MSPGEILVTLLASFVQAGFQTLHSVCTEETGSTHYKTDTNIEKQPMCGYL